ncbi:hypothetical protein JMJ56_05885 [Belnapia sp. T18]|uniref:Sialate O-acetylesterase domain-containing protein n=1 Tax=Belnapia arida TaxID=2804533 RepID=A0ABS1U088_9PROT|nr:hypothetical protein [Belnapia arida]MBL6077530.1 hypothetical protein [Belnapia arida]
MQLNVLFRGQSNAQLMGDYNGGAQAMVHRVEELLGFDGVTDEVKLEYSSNGRNGNTVFSGTSLLGDWLKPGTDGEGWATGRLEQRLLDFVGHLPAAQKAEPTAVVWFHSEYDSRDAHLSPAEWESAVRGEAAALRAAYGQDAAALPYHFVSAIPYSDGSDAGHQAIRIGMEELAADPAFNARIGARALDTDMSFNNLDADWRTRDYGGPHQSNSDGMQTGERLALSLAQDWAEYAKPGSPVALAGGQVDDLGPQVVQASRVGDRQLALTVAHDAAHSLAPLDADAARGTGWAAIGDAAGAKIEASAATVTGPGTLLLEFAAPVPADARLFYGHGNGRLAGADGSGRGNAVYDDQGMPVWIGAHGLVVDGTIHAPATASAGLQGGDGADVFSLGAGSGGGIFTGGAGADQWVVAAGAGGATVADFASGLDHLVFTGIAAESLVTTPTAAGGLAITFDAAGHSLTLPSIAALAPGDVVFA